MKKFRPILGISLCVQSITFFILFLVYAEKKKNLAKAFAAISAAGGIAGAALLISEAKKNKKPAEDEDDFDDFEDDFDELDVDEDDILCSFEGEDENGNGNEAGEEA